MGWGKNTNWLCGSFLSNISYLLVGSKVRKRTQINGDRLLLKFMREFSILKKLEILI